MQAQALNNVLDHLRTTFDFDKEETTKLLHMLHKTLAESTDILGGDLSDSIYHTAHKLHSELHMCGYDHLSELAADIEAQAKSGVIDRTLIEHFLSTSSDFMKTIEAWLSEPNA